MSLSCFLFYLLIIILPFNNCLLIVVTLNLSTRCRLRASIRGLYFCIFLFFIIFIYVWNCWIFFFFFHVVMQVKVVRLMSLSRQCPRAVTFSCHLYLLRIFLLRLITSPFFVPKLSTRSNPRSVSCSFSLYIFTTWHFFMVAFQQLSFRRFYTKDVHQMLPARPPASQPVSTLYISSSCFLYRVHKSCRQLRLLGTKTWVADR